MYIPSDAVILSLDVAALYTNITHSEAYRILALCLDQRDDLYPPTSFLLELLELILKKNYFRFLDKFFMQIKGVAMGSAAAPSIANLFMSAFETEHILNDSNPYVQYISFFRRYIDDLLMIFTQEESVPEFIIWLNSRDSNIQFTAQYNRDIISFLDVYIYRNEYDKLSIRPYRKSTDKNTYLHYKSFHPLHLRSNLPFGQFLRFKRNSTTQVDFVRETRSLYNQLESRGYPRHILNRVLDRAREVPRSSLLLPKERRRKNRITWAIDYTPMSNRICRIVLKNWHVLRDIPGCEIPPQIGFCKTRSLRNSLARTDILMPTLSQDSSLPKGHFKCGHCKVCPTVMASGVIKPNGRDFVIRYDSFSTCATEGVTYLIECYCDPPLYYVGKTLRPLRTRLLEHQSCLRLKTLEAPLVDHFILAKHSEQDFKHTVLYVGKKHGQALGTELLRSEAFWINSLNTISPLGMNMNNNLSCFL